MDVISIPVHNRVHWDFFFLKISNVKMLFYIVPTLVQRCHWQQNVQRVREMYISDLRDPYL